MTASDRDWLITGGRVLDPSQKLDGKRDLWIRDGRIAAIEKPGVLAKSERLAGTPVIEADDGWVVPGLIDAHVHLREPGFEYKETLSTGTLAAAAGGFTSVACMANTMPVNDSAAVTAFIRERARATAHVRVFPIGAVSKGLQGQELAEIGGMAAEGARAISDDGMPVMNSYLMRKAMEYAKAFGIPVISHAEDANLVGGGVMNEGPGSNALGLRGNPAAAEEILVAREIALCRLTRCPTHIAHVSTAAAVRHIRRAKEDGLPVTAEVTPHHLTLTDAAVATYDTCCKMAPPLRSEEDVASLVQALNEGVIDLIATDHAPHGLIDKDVEFDQAANGIIGLQTALSLTLELVQNRRLKLSRWLDALTAAPARLLGIPHGNLRRGADADVTILDPERSYVFAQDQILSKSANSPYLGRKLRGRARQTWVGGELRFNSQRSESK